MKSLYLLFSLDILNLAIFLPVFSAFIRSLGGTPFTLGLINSSSALVSLLWNPIVGSLSDQVGRKGLLLKCLIASSLGSLLMAISSSIPLVFLGRLIGAFGSPVGILLRSTVADIYKTPADKKMFFNKSAPFMSIAFLVGSLSSGFLSETQNGFSKAFIIMSAVMGFAAIIVSRILPNDIKAKETRKKNTSIPQKVLTELQSALSDLKTISWTRYRTLFYVRGLYDFSLALIFANIGLLLFNDYNIKGRQVGYVFMTLSLCRIVSNVLKLVLKNFLSRIPDQLKVRICGIILALCFVTLSLASSLTVLIVSLGTMSLVRAFMDTILLEVVAVLTTETDKGKVIGAYENLYLFASVVAPLISGVVGQVYGQRILVGFAAIPVSMAVYLARKERRD